MTVLTDFLNLTEVKAQSAKTNVDETLKRVSNVVTFVNGSKVTFSSQQFSPRFGCAPETQKKDEILAAQKVIDGLSYKAEAALVSGLPERAPESFEAFSKTVFGSIYNATAALLMYQKGKLIHEKYANGFDRNSIFDLGIDGSYSFASMFPAARQKEGKLDLDEWSHCPELKLLDRRARNMTARNLMAMRIGSPTQNAPSVGATKPWWDYDNYKLLHCVKDKANYAAVVPTSYASGTVPTEWKSDHYITPGTASLLMRELRFTFPDTNSGFTDYASYPWTHLFSKMAAPSFVVEMDPSGTFIGYEGVSATARDMLKLVVLLVTNGKWKELELLPIEYTKRNFNNPFGATKPFSEGWHSAEFPGLPRIVYVIAEKGYVVAVPELEFAVADFHKEHSQKHLEQMLFVHFPGLLIKQRVAWRTTTATTTTFTTTTSTSTRKPTTTMKQTTTTTSRLRTAALSTSLKKESGTDEAVSSLAHRAGGAMHILELMFAFIAVVHASA